MDAETKQSSLREVVIHTDGAAVPNPGAGGYGVVLRFEQHKKELSGGYQRTTSNRMELMAAIVALEALKERCKVTLYSDSQYVVESVVGGYARRWRANDWSLTKDATKKAKNPDLWERLLALCDRHEVELIWVKGHSGIADNDRCDVLAMAACKRPALLPDPGFVELVSETEKKAMERPKPVRVHRDKMKSEGQPCRNCGTAVVKRNPKKRAVKEGQAFTYSWYLYCPGCRNMYMVDEAKVQLPIDRLELFDQEE